MTLTLEVRVQNPMMTREKIFPGDHGVANIWGNHMHGLILTTISEKPYLPLLLARDRGGFELAIQTS
jgi:hypothetical protein